MKKLHSTAGKGLSKTPTAEIERNLYGVVVAPISKVIKHMLGYSEISTCEYNANFVHNLKMCANKILKNEKL